MRATIALPVLLLLAGCSGEALTPRQEANRWALAEAEPVGAPVECVEISRIRNTIGRDDRTIDFWMIDGRVLRNRLPRECAGLAFEDSFLYRTALDRLCAGDAVTVIRSDGTRGPTCALGGFQQVQIAPRD